MRIIPLLDGGIQEGGRRAGTEDVPAIVGLGKAAEIAAKEMTGRIQKLVPLRDKLLTQLPAKIEHVVVTGHPQESFTRSGQFLC